MTPEPLPLCGERRCPHPAHQPLARRIAAQQPEPVVDRRPAWLARLTPRDMTEAH